MPRVVKYPTRNSLNLDERFNRTNNPFCVHESSETNGNIMVMLHYQLYRH